MLENTKAQMQNDIKNLLKNNMSDAYIEAKMWAKWSGQFSIKDIAKTIEANKEIET